MIYFEEVSVITESRFLEYGINLDPEPGNSGINMVPGVFLILK
jgi:hypothetical protein